MKLSYYRIYSNFPPNHGPLSLEKKNYFTKYMKRKFDKNICFLTNRTFKSTYGPSTNCIML